jgi:carboxylesterase type B
MASHLSEVAVLSLSLALSAGCSGARTDLLAHEPDPPSERTITQGKVVGFVEQPGAHAWLGIPFAEPPVGPLRWRAPVPKKPWEGTFQAVRFGRSCVQLVSPIGGREDDKRGRFQGSEDCLTLNVFAPQAAPEKVPQGKDRLPVMVWIHGGGNKIGASSTYSLAGNLAARHGVVVVSMNYRLGVMGWFRHPALVAEGDSPEDRSGNYGTLDQILALKWVRDNAAAFGGDPGNVTIFGESAGGIDVFSLLTSPMAKGLFHRAISESGLPASVDVKTAEDFTADLLLTLLVRDGRAQDHDRAKAVAQGMSAADVAAYLRGKTADQLIEPLDPGLFAMYSSPNLLRDGAVLPAQPFLELVTDASRYNAVPVLLGTNRDEMKLFLSRDPAFISNWLWLVPHIRDRARYDGTARYVSGLWKAVGADMPASVMRRAQGPSVYAYRFDWDEEPEKLGVDLSELLGACHAMEISFVFDNMARGGFGVPESGPAWDGYRTLASAMSGYWTQFAKTGSPGRGPDGTLPEWKPWSDEAPQADRFMVFDSPAGGGVRMSPEAVTVEGLTERLEHEPTFDGAPRARCRAYARMLSALELVNLEPGNDAYARFADGACREFPQGSFLADKGD